MKQFLLLFKSKNEGNYYDSFFISFFLFSLLSSIWFKKTNEIYWLSYFFLEIITRILTIILLNIVKEIVKRNPQLTYEHLKQKVEQTRSHNPDLLSKNNLQEHPLKR